MMSTTRKTALLLAVALYLIASSSRAQDRQLLYSKAPSDKLMELVEQVRRLDSEPTPYDELSPKSDFFVRVTKRKFVLDKDQLLDSARLGGNPFVFFTTPQGIVGKS